MSDSQARIDGAKLRALRIQARLTRPALARATGLSQDTIFKIETGNRNASEISAGLIADALGVRVAELTPERIAA